MNRTPDIARHQRRCVLLAHRLAYEVINELTGRAMYKEIIETMKLLAMISEPDERDRFAKVMENYKIPELYTTKFLSLPGDDDGRNATTEP